MILALPGMGADERMFPAPWNSLPNFTALNWKSWSGENSVPALAETICRNASIKDGDTLVGASLGGMVACEIAKLRRIKTLFLVGSATDQREVNRALELMRPLVNLPLFDWLRISAGKIPHDLLHMFADADPAFIRTMCAAIFQWKGLGDAEVKVFRIHGRSDLVIPCPAKPDLLLKGGHLISISHAAECVDFIRNRLVK
jgi:pimeloyl-ACP methyl ester carboxylesterase